MACALCRKNARLVLSHIIPEFLYKSLYDGKHRFTQISTSESKRNLFLQKGIREKLLCVDCERSLSVFERYASLVLYGGIGIDVEPRGNWLHISKLDYPKLKLFLLSVLWRAGISSLNIFRHVSLGPHAEIIRRMLAHEDPGDPDQYGCLMCLTRHEGQPVTDIVSEPTKSKLDKYTAYNFIVGGLVLVYVVTSQRPSKFISEHFVQPSGECSVRLTELIELKFLTRTILRMREQGKLGPNL